MHMHPNVHTATALSVCALALQHVAVLERTSIVMHVLGSHSDSGGVTVKGDIGFSILDCIPAQMNFSTGLRDHRERPGTRICTQIDKQAQIDVRVKDFTW